jgi:hypothetical protein
LNIGESSVIAVQVTKEKDMKRVPLMLTVIALAMLALVVVGSTLTASARRFVAAMPTVVSVQGATNFSSAYTGLTKCGSGMTKKEENEAEQRGTDIPTRCKGYGGYDVYIYYSACSSQFSLMKGDENISLGMQAIDWKQKTVEWRMANNKPFAIILRVYEYAGDDLCATNGKVTGEALIVRGLKGFDHIDETVNVKGTPNPNLKARELADKGYALPKS